MVKEFTSGAGRRGPHLARQWCPLVPGLLLAGAAVAVSLVCHHTFRTVSTLTFAVALGVIFGNCGIRKDALDPGLRFATKRLLRCGVVLLGLRLAVPDVLGLGWRTLLVVISIVLLTFFGTRWLGRRMGLSDGTSLLVATGFSICGASAVAAMDGVTRNRKEDAATAVALVTLFGSLAMVTLPLLAQPLGLSAHSFGIWAGASVHDVAQTVATASAAGPAALTTAVVVKLTRVVMLAPLVAGMSLWQRRAPASGQARQRLAAVPLFVVGFLAMVGVRSLDVLPDQVLGTAQTVETVLLAAALFGLGSDVHLRTLARTGARALGLGFTAWVLIAGLSFAGVCIIGR